MNSNTDQNMDLSLQNLIEILQELKITEEPRYATGDMGNARLFADVFKNCARYVPLKNCWYVFNMKRWEADPKEMRVKELAKELTVALLEYANKFDGEKRDYYRRRYGNWTAYHSREKFIKDAQSEYPIDLNEFDTNPYLFNCQNGTLDLRTGKLHNHNAQDMITKISPVIYDAKARFSRFDQFVTEITNGDKDLAAFLQKALGYGLGGNSEHECMFILYGRTTRNGKGTLVESCLKVLGDYGCTARPETLAAKKYSSSESHSEDIARLHGIHFVSIPEPKQDLVLNAPLIKALTGNDTVNARLLYNNSFDFKPQCKLYVNTNYLPTVDDETLFLSGRLVVIPFERHFEENEQDNNLKALFSLPDAQSAILNWLIDGYNSLRNQGLKKPNAVVNAIQTYHDSVQTNPKYRPSNDSVAMFFEECLEMHEGCKVRSREVYVSYRDWCKTNRITPMHEAEFKGAMERFVTYSREKPEKGASKTTVIVDYCLKSPVVPECHARVAQSKD